MQQKGQRGRKETASGGQAPKAKSRKAKGNEQQRNGAGAGEQGAIAVARGYLMRATPWMPVPVHSKSKAAFHDEWQKLEITLDNLAKYFPPGMPLNVGVRLG